MASTTQSTDAGDETQTSTTVPSIQTSTSPKDKNIEMTDLEGSKTAPGGAGLLDPIPSSSPLDSSFPVSSPYASTSDENTKPPTDGPASSAVPASSPAVIATSSSTTDPLSSSSNAPAPTTSSNLPTPSVLPAATSTPTPITRSETVAIGPADTPSPTTTTADSGPVLIITLLLPSGARHPYKLDEKYLLKRSVTVPEKTATGKLDPYSISIYTLKELILREWREEWEAKPSNPSSIRLINFGRVLEDNYVLKDCRFTADAANVVHMTVKPQEFVEEEEARDKANLTRQRDGGESTAGCRCVIQ